MTISPRSHHILRLALALACAPAVGSSQEVDGFPLPATPFDSPLIDDLEDEIESETYRDIRSVVVLRAGKLLVERYYGGATRDSLHNPRSVGKTFAAALLGLALRDGHIQSIDQTLGEFYELERFANASPEKAGVTLRHLLTMTSGFEGFDFDPSSPGNEDNMYSQPNWVEWTLSLPMAKDRRPGERWAYFTAGVVVLGDILSRRVPGGLEVYADRTLFQPLGIRRYEWQHTPQRVGNTAGGLQLTSLGFAKFGELHRTRGKWNGRQVLPESWARACLERHVETGEGENDYGYLWWNRAFEVEGRSLRAAYCSGNGGNKIFVFADEPLVIVITASAYNRPYAHSQVDEMMTEFILPAVLP